MSGVYMKKRMLCLAVVLLLSLTSCRTVKDTDIKVTDIAVEQKEYESYYMDSYLKPVWDGQVVYNETVMFMEEEEAAELLYSPDRIISVRSYDLQTEYEAGRDYELREGRLCLTTRSRIPCMARDEYYTDDPQYAQLITKGNAEADGSYTYWGEGETMTKWQVAVTYTHSDRWDGFVPESCRDQYTELFRKLDAGEDVTFIFYGDSITYGANASFIVGTEPQMPSWPILFTSYLAKQYGYTVHYITEGKVTAPVLQEDTVYGTNGVIAYINPSVGGWTVVDGYTNADEYVIPLAEKYGCDLFTVAFGGNDGDKSAKKVRSVTEAIIKKVQDVSADTGIVIVSPMLPNPEATNGWYGTQGTFHEEFVQSAKAYQTEKTPCGVCPMTEMSRSILEKKQFRDCTGNNINHPNDFLARVYAQTMIATVIGY